MEGGGGAGGTSVYSLIRRTFVRVCTEFDSGEISGRAQKPSAQRSAIHFSDHHARSCLTWTFESKCSCSAPLTLHESLTDGRLGWMKEAKERCYCPTDVATKRRQKSIIKLDQHWNRFNKCNISETSDRGDGAHVGLPSRSHSTSDGTELVKFVVR